MTASFERDLRPLFSESDRDAMAWAFDLWSHADVSANSDEILERISERTMPCDRAWPEDDVATLRRWIDEGKQP